MESDGVNPLNIYGHSKAVMEKEVLRILPQALLVRTSCFFGPWDDYNFVTTILHSLRRGEKVAVATDVVISPTYLPHLVDACLDLLIDGAGGIWHLANEGTVTWAQLAYKVAAWGGERKQLLVEKTLVELNLPAPRPHYSALGSERGQLLPSWETALHRYFADRKEFEARIQMPHYTPRNSGLSENKDSFAETPK
jgi:dTDP-4-dehydrorhamnose reductase